MVKAFNFLTSTLHPALTLRTFWRHRKEMNEILSSGAGITHKKYYRLMIIACLDTLFNVPVLITNLVTDILQGQDNGLNYPYISWEDVHNGAGGNLPGLSLSSILQTPASGWSTDKWNMFEVKWDEWVYVLHAITFFVVFGTTPEMCQYTDPRFGSYRSDLGTRGGVLSKWRLFLTSRSPRIRVSKRKPVLLLTGEPVNFYLFRQQPNEFDL